MKHKGSTHKKAIIFLTAIFFLFCSAVHAEWYTGVVDENTSGFSYAYFSMKIDSSDRLHITYCEVPYGVRILNTVASSCSTRVRKSSAAEACLYLFSLMWR